MEAARGGAGTRSNRLLYNQDRWPRERRRLLQPSPPPQASDQEPRRDVLNFGFLAPENILYPMGRLKVARGGEGGLGAQFSIAGEGGDVLPAASWGEQGTFCAAQALLSAGSRLVFLQHRPACSLSDVCGKERCWEMEGAGKASFLSRSPKRSGVRSRVPFGVPPLWHCALWGYVAIKLLVLPQLFHERKEV